MEGYKAASKEYEQKFKKQAKVFLIQEQAFEKDKEEYEKVMDEYEKYIEYLGKELSDLKEASDIDTEERKITENYLRNKIRREQKVFDELKKCSETI